MFNEYVQKRSQLELTYKKEVGLEKSRANQTASYSKTHVAKYPQKVMSKTKLDYKIKQVELKPPPQKGKLMNFRMHRQSSHLDLQLHSDRKPGLIRNENVPKVEQPKSSRRIVTDCPENNEESHFEQFRFQMDHSIEHSQNDLADYVRNHH